MQNLDLKPSAQNTLTEYTCPSEDKPSQKSLFIAGGISNCPDWQAEFIQGLNDQNIAAFNPRRLNFPIDDPSASEFQIDWEHRKLRQSDAISFWFPKETVCPITLYELGVHTMGTKPVFVGLDPEYQLADEVIALTSVHRPDIQIVRSLNELAEQVKNWSSKELFSEQLKSNPPPLLNTIFIAGGIRNCPDWQSSFYDLIEQSKLQIQTKRDPVFLKGEIEDYRAKLIANHQALMRSEIVSFWFPKETMNPVVLYELGIASKTGKPLFIGVESGYARSIDVEIQTALVRPEVSIAHSLEELANQINSFKA